MFGTLLWIFASVWILLQVALMVLRVAVSGRAPIMFDVVSAAVGVVVFPTVVASVVMLSWRRRPAWVRVSAAGVELAATRRQPVLLPWSAVRAVRLRYRGPFTELLVTPSGLDADAVAPIWAWAPRLHRRSGAPAFVVDVGMLTPGPSVLLAELDRRLAARA
ncbi:hypothetical protein GCM10022255_012740 [Dactylosporangium darangshiense]|uniref:PH domain-containing protein n=1 Tax=Dactylosporangium darangshiense TaxID=579108 RepID=A0ABP8CZT3_9ACTN